MAKSANINMPYNTRRKSLSLPSLGIQLPNHSRAHRSNSNSKFNSPPADTPLPPAKRVKRSHDGSAPLSPSASPKESPTQPLRRVVAQTPPPSPGDIPSGMRKIDTEGINDDIVIAVIEQLEKTGNRPHLIKELATVLASTNDNIAHSANSAALLSSRLSSYLKRPWTALSPCPLAKELIPVHPRKVFFFLTTQPRTPLPENSNDIITVTPSSKRLTPSISDPSVEADEDIDLNRSRLSPSPEVELYSPELESEHHSVANNSRIDRDSPVMPSTPTIPGETFSGRTSLNPDGTQETRTLSRQHHRAPSPPLEADEKGFTETATAVRARGLSLLQPVQNVIMSIEAPRRDETESAEMRMRRDQEELFGGYVHSTLGGGLQVPDHTHQKLLASSPLMRGHSNTNFHSSSGSLKLLQIDTLMSVDDVDVEMLSPQHIDVEDLDGMFSGY